MPPQAVGRARRGLQLRRLRLPPARLAQSRQPHRQTAHLAATRRCAAGRWRRRWRRAPRSACKTAYLGCVGHDHNGRLIISELQQRGVDVSHVLTRECANRFAVITVDETSGERIVLWDRDDRLNLAPREIDPALIASARLVHVDDEDQEAAIAAAHARAAAPACRARATSIASPIAPRT